MLGYRWNKVRGEMGILGVRFLEWILYKKLYKIFLNSYIKNYITISSKGGYVRRSELIKRLEKLDFEIKEGGKHTGIYKDGKRLSTVSRSKEIAEKMLMVIEKQIGQKIK